MKNRFLVFGIVATLFFIGCSERPPVKQSEIALGTLIEISVADKDKSLEQIKEALEVAFSAIRKIETLMSTYQENSEVSRLNRLKIKESLRVSDETLEVIKKSLEFNKLSQGAFDISVYPLLKLWGFTRDTSGDKKGVIPPSREKIEETLLLVGLDKVIIDETNKTVSFVQEGVKIDLGAIAKGYAVDKAIEALKSRGIKNALVNAGGDIYCLRMKSRHRKWTVGLQHPRKPKAILTTLKIKDKAVTTSGDYERYFMIEGKRFPHIINPRTGYPVEEIPLSVSILAKDCMSADALATAVFVLGPEAGLNLINKIKGVEGVIISRAEGEMKIETSRGLEGKLKFRH